jgi:hypothetical protein
MLIRSESSISLTQDASKFVRQSNFFFYFLQLVLVNPTGEVMEKIQRANVPQNHFRSDCLYLTTGEAVASLSALAKMTKP